MSSPRPLREGDSLGRAGRVIHYGDAGRPTKGDPQTWCGRPRDHVVYWATPETAEHMTFAPICGSCAASLKRRNA